MALIRAFNELLWERANAIRPFARGLPSGRWSAFGGILQVSISPGSSRSLRNGWPNDPPEDHAAAFYGFMKGKQRSAARMSLKGPWRSRQNPFLPASMLARQIDRVVLKPEREFRQGEVGELDLLREHSAPVTALATERGRVIRRHAKRPDLKGLGRAMRQS